jgi:predicted house-cleaning noncanonical NTP pyrophosphatase (MazG superfamily)
MVRDEIPSLIEGHGEHVTLARISKSDSRAALVVKLFEESHELLMAQSPKEVTAELADLVEVLKSLSAATGVDWDEVQRAAEQKRATRGSFDRNVVLLETSWPNWAEKNNSKLPNEISLSELGGVIKTRNAYTVTFPAVLGNGGRNVVTLPSGARVTVSIGGAGITIEEIERAETSADQFTFDFDKK